MNSKLKDIALTLIALGTVGAVLAAFLYGTVNTPDSDVTKQLGTAVLAMFAALGAYYFTKERGE